MIWWNIGHVSLGVLLIMSILLQQRGSSLGAGFGGDSAVFHTLRGAEKVLFYATITLGILFFGLALARVIAL